MNKKGLIIVGILFVAAGVLAAFYYFKTNSNQDKAAEQNIVKTDLEEGKIASGFPTDLPIEQGSETEQSYEATSKDGRKQSTLSTTTQKDFNFAINTYRDYFIEKGWTEIQTSPSDPNLPEAMFRKNDDVLLISTMIEPDSGKKTIELSLTESAKN